LYDNVNINVLVVQVEDFYAKTAPVIFPAALNSFESPSMKKAILTILQLLLFLLIFGVGSLFPPFHIEHVLSTTTAATRIFIADGLVLAVAFYILILLVEAFRKRLRESAPWTSLALILALVLGFMMKFGFLTRSEF
jgi:hypothetical protein